MLDTKQLGKRIALLRKQNGMSQEKLAELLCISPQAISKWENGHTTPDTSLLPVLAQIFQCSIDEIIMPAYLFEADIEEKKPNKLDMQARHIADYIIEQLGGAMPEEIVGLSDAEIIEAVCHVHPNLGNYQIMRGKPEPRIRYISIYITVTTAQKELRLVEKVYHDDIMELLGYELFSRHVKSIPQVYCIDFDKKILLMDEVTDSIQGFQFDEDGENGEIFRNNYRTILKEIAKIHAAFWENKETFKETGLDWRHETKENLLAHIDGMERDFLVYRNKEATGKIPKVWNGWSNVIDADKLDYFQAAISLLRQRYVPLIDERFNAGKNITMIHGDLHPGNIFVSKPPASSVKIIDMEAVRVGLCTEDLAMFVALHIEPDKKHAKPLLDYYYECLCQNVKDYSYEMFMDDYRISIMEAMFYAIRLINRGICDFVMRDKAIRAYETFVLGKEIVL
ncbi:MAG: helix-turn-helix domain-containing protein [Butyrivibrio sp.]|nr:helix-turn-helix domain-containing protein [Butyrivibrio sp.]